MVEGQKFSKTFYTSKQVPVSGSQILGGKKDYRKQLRVGSRGGDPSQKSLEGSQFSEIAQLFHLNLVNPAIDENLLGSQLKVEAIHIQDQINKLDPDGILRQAQGIGFGKPYINQIKKWVGINSSINARDLIDARIGTPLDSERIMEFLNVRTEAEGMKKLFKFLASIDVVASKIAELEMLTFLKYEDNFASLVKKPIPSTSSIHSLSAGIQLNRFHTSQINLERNIELFNIANKLTGNKINTTNTTSSINYDIKHINSIEELISSLNSNQLPVPQDLTLIISNHLAKYQALQIDHSKLLANYQNMQSSIQEKKEIQEKKDTTISNNNETDKNYYLKLIDEITNQNKEDKDKLEQQCSKLNQQYLELQIKMDGINQKWKETLKEKEEIFKQKEKLQLSAQHSYKSSKEYVEGYESAMREELQHMKRGYEDLIEELHESIEKIKKDKGLELIDLKRDLTREGETKRLLLKKLNVFLKI